MSGRPDDAPASADAAPPRAGRGAGAFCERRFAAAVAMIAGVAAAVRVWSVYGLARTQPFGPGGDGFYYLVASKNVGEGYGFVANQAPTQPEALHPPLWTSVLGIAHRLGAQSLEQKGLVAGALGVLTVVLVALAARRVLDARAGVVAGAIAALSPALWTYERNLNAEAVTFPLLAALVLTSYRYKDRPSLGRALAVAAVLGLLALARSEQAALVLLVLVPLVLATRDLGWGARLGRLAACGAVIACLLAPWTIYNLGRFERPVILSAGAGNAMVAGACDTTFDGELLGSADFLCAIASPAMRASDDSTVRDAGMRSEAIRYSLDHADRLPVVILAREGRTWSAFRLGQQAELQSTALSVPEPVVWIQVVAFWIMVPLAVAGVVALRRRSIVVYPLLAMIGLSAFAAATTLGDLRYRAPAEVAIVVLTSVAISAGVGAWQQRRSETDGPPVVSEPDVVSV